MMRLKELPRSVTEAQIQLKSIACPRSVQTRWTRRRCFFLFATFVIEITSCDCILCKATV
jgi:hypothetical protein